MREILRKIKDSKWTVVAVQVLGLLAVMQWIVFPALTTANTLINIVGFVLMLIVLASIGILLFENTKPMDKKEDDGNS